MSNLRKAIGCLIAGLTVAAPLAAGAQEPIRIGILSDMTGPFSGLAGMGSVYGAQLAVEDFGGQVLGRKIEIVQGDHQNKPDVGAVVVRRWFDNEGVSVVADVIGSAVGLAVQSIIREKKKIAILSGSGADDLIGKQCAPGGLVWAFNTYTQANVIGTGLMEKGFNTWYLVSQDSAFGHAIERNISRLADAKKAKVVGVSRFPITNQEFSSMLLSAQASKAKIIALTGGDVANFMKQAHEFKISAQQNVTAFMVWIQWVHALGPEAAQGLFLSSSFYWDLNDQTRAWSQRFYKKAGFMPSMTHAASYSGITHYLKAVAKAGTTDQEKVLAAMHQTPVEDATAKGRLRADGLLLRDFYVFEVKKPSESKSEWDLYKLANTVPADIAAPPPNSDCPLVKH